MEVKIIGRIVKMGNMKKYCLFIMIALGIVVCLWNKDSYLFTPIVSNPDSQITFTTENGVLEQTWQSNVKKIAGIRVPYLSTEDFDALVEVNVYSDNYEKLLVSAQKEQHFGNGEAGCIEFLFDKVKVVPGERYRIQLIYKEPSAYGALLIDSGMNYGGCTIDGEESEEAAALEVTVIKQSHLFWLFSVFYPMLAISLLFMVAFERKWEETVGLSLIIVVFIMYLFGLFECLQTGVMWSYVLGTISLVGAAYIQSKKQLSLKQLVSPGLIVYGGLFLLILLNTRGVWLARWDEYSHWGLAVKDMFYYDSFAKHYNTTVMLPRYLPFSTLVEYYFVQANGMFSQEILYVAYQTTLLSVLIIICNIAKRTWKLCVPAVLVMVTLPIIFFSDVYNSIYVDPLLAVFAAYVLICYFTEEMSLFNLFRVLGGLFALTMTKDMGLVMAGLLTMIMFFDRVRIAFISERRKWRGLILPCVLASWVLLSFFSWQIYLSIPVTAVEKYSETQDYIEAEGEQSVEAVAYTGAIKASGITLEKIQALLKGDAENYKYQSIKNYLVMLFDEDTFRFGNVGLSYIDIQILILWFLFALAYKGNRDEERGWLISFGIFSGIAGLIYCVILEIMYLFAFRDNEAVYLVSNGRYLGSWMCGVVIAALYFFMQWSEKRKNMANLILTAVLIMCFPMTNMVITNRHTEVTEDMVYGNEQIEEMFRSISRKGEKVYLVCNNSDGYSYYIFKNAVCPLLTSTGGWDIYSSEDMYKKQVQLVEANGKTYKGVGSVLSSEAWIEELNDYQYVYLYHPAEIFAEMYGNMFEEPETIDDGALYQVNTENEKMELVYIGKVGLKTYR